MAVADGLNSLSPDTLILPDLRNTRLGDECIVRSFSVIYSGVQAGNRFDVGHQVVVREDARFGDDCYLKPGADVRRSVRAGDRVTISDLVGDRSVLGDDVTCLGKLVHKSSGAHRGDVEPAPVLLAGVFVGRNAVLVGEITIGEGAFIAAGSIVTADVPPNTRVIGYWGQ